MREDLAQVYRTSRNVLPAEQRPKGEVLLKCLNSKWTHEPLAEKAVTDIALRWQQLKYSRDIYLNDLLSKEFDSFRASLAFESLSWKIRAAIVEPGFVKFSSAMSRQENSRGFDRDFKSRFHESLCLPSIGIISRSIAVASRDRVVYSPNLEPDEDVNEDVAKMP